MSVKKTIYVVVGPTAVGKTHFAIELAQLLQTEIISADSRQFYKEMKIGTAVPSSEELNKVKHHFIQHLSIHEDYNVHRFENDALNLIDDLFDTFNNLIVVGGSGLYLNALAYGIDDLPDPSDETRQFLDNVHQKHGLDGLRSLLLEKDPAFYNQVDIHNPNRLKRALEVCITTNKPYSEQRMQTAKERHFNIQWIGLHQQREKLNQKINQRVDLMIEDGLLEEVKNLYPYKTLNALNTVGYREFFSWLDGDESYDWALEKVKTNSRRYAKRQMTWFRKNKDIQWLDVDDIKAIENFKQHFIQLNAH